MEQFLIENCIQIILTLFVTLISFVGRVWFHFYLQSLYSNDVNVLDDIDYIEEDCDGKSIISNVDNRGGKIIVNQKGRYEL